jgi:hypothetical protein
MTTIDLTEPANKLSEFNRPNGEISGPDLGLDCLGVIRPDIIRQTRRIPEYAPLVVVFYGLP